MTETKKILLIGRSGRGKSALANVLTNTNKFKESFGSASETKKIQSEAFDPEQEKLSRLLEKLNNLSLDEEDKEVLKEYLQNKEKAKYLIIDTPGIGDTKMSDNEVLDIIAEAVYLAKDGINQVFFVVNGRFDQSEMATYNLLITIIFDKEIINHTTITRTNFENFKNKRKCQEDMELMVSEAKEKKTELETKLTAKEKFLKTLSVDNDNYHQLLEETQQLKKQLEVTNLAEIMDSCKNKFIHVDNPSINIDPDDDEDEDEKEEREKKLFSRKETRTKSRKILLTHLQSSCQENSYQPQKLQELSNEITDDYFHYMNKKAELAAELARLSTINTNAVITPHPNVATIAKEGEIVITKNQEQAPLTETDNKLAIGERISHLENKRAKLEQEIATKEKVIRQKVLKHIFNNYEGINKELGGDIFLGSVINHQWENIHPDFTNKELILSWLTKEFDYEQVQKWAIVLSKDFRPTTDLNFIIWLRDELKLTVERLTELIHVRNITQLRAEYAKWLEGITTALDQHINQLKSPAQQWLDNKYPWEWRKELTELSISGRGLTGALDLTDFSNLTELYCSDNNLTKLELSKEVNLTALDCNNNNLTSLVFLSQFNINKLTWLNISSNNFPKSDLTIFSQFTNLERLFIGSDEKGRINHWYGSLVSLQTLTKLTWLGISNTDINSGLEYLLDLEYFNCATNLRTTALVKELVQALTIYGEPDEYGGWDNYASLLKKWKQAHPQLVVAVNQSNLTAKELISQIAVPPKS